MESTTASRKKILRPSGKTVDFEHSTALKSLFFREFERWNRHNAGGLDELARRCGVSTAYLAHVRRYGRIPSKPVLYLLALNFQLDRPDELLRAAAQADEWPYDEGIALARREKSPSGFLSVKLDMDGFVDAIKGVVRGEMRQRNLSDLAGKRPLRVGYNHTQDWMFAGGTKPGPFRYDGLFPALCEMLSVSLQRDIETVDVPFPDHVDQLRRGEIDIFGPMMVGPLSDNGLRFTDPLYRLRVCALSRVRETANLEKLPAPSSSNDLRDPRYKIAVLRNSLPHLLMKTRFPRPDSHIVVCNSDEEGIDRVLLRGISEPAHFYVVNGVLGKRYYDQHPTELDLLFHQGEDCVDMADNSISVRPDWPELVPILNESIRFVMSRGRLAERFTSLLTKDLHGFVSMV